MLKVTGMSCGHCAGVITKTVQGAAPGARVTVDLKSGLVDVTGPHDVRSIIAAIERVGYQVEQQAA